MPDEGPEISFEHLTVKKGSFVIQADARLGSGVHLLTGRIGTGKTTMGEVIAGILRPDKGNLEWKGNKRVMLMQDASFHISTTTVFKEAKSWQVDPDVVLNLAGLSEKRDCDLFLLSRGELRRLMLGAILSRNDDLVVLDEPFAGLDYEAQRIVNRLISKRRDRITVIISHCITMLPHIDRIWEMHMGRLLDIGTVPEAFSRWERAPILIRYLSQIGHPPTGLSQSDLEEAACRIQESG